jgi:osmotically-inducible protein OsmY
MKRSLLALTLIGVLGVSLSGCVFPLLVGGAAGTAMVASDRRTSGAYVDDQSIALKAASQLSNKFPAAHVNVTSYNRTALMTGELQTDDLRMQAEMQIRALPGVTRVYNYTVVAEPTTLGQRNNDVWITGKVRGRMLGVKTIPSQAIKVVSERGVVYLFGLVTHAEGDAATAVASQTAGVLKVVQLYEYIDAVPSAMAAPVAASQTVSNPPPAETQPAETQPLAQ